MIASFSVIAMSGHGLDPAKVAKGISEALLLTFEGVALSVPSIFFFAIFRNRVSLIATEAGMEADQFLRHFAHAARAKGPAAGPGAAAAAPAGAAKVAPRLE
jgi:biopolymer transport protein ExbB